MKTATRLLVTHNLDILPHASIILVIEDGKIAQRGTFAELQASPGWLHETLQQLGKGLGSSLNRVSSGKEGSCEEEELDINVDGKATAVMATEAEERIIGSVTWSQYGRYAKLLGGVPSLSVLALGTIIQEAGTVGTSIVLGLWSGSQISGFTQGPYIVSVSPQCTSSYLTLTSLEGFIRIHGIDSDRISRFRCHTIRCSRVREPSAGPRV